MRQHSTQRTLGKMEAGLLMAAALGLVMIITQFAGCNQIGGREAGTADHRQVEGGEGDRSTP